MLYYSTFLAANEEGGYRCRTFYSTIILSLQGAQDSINLHEKTWDVILRQLTTNDNIDHSSYINHAM